MEEVTIEIRETKDKIRQAEADGDAKRRDRLEEYLLELQREKNLLLSAPPGNPTLPSLPFLSIMI